MHTVISCFARAVVAAAVITASLAAQEQRLPRTPAPLDAVTTIVDAFRTHEETTSRLSASLCGDQRYRAMRTQRLMLAGNERAADVLDRECPVKR